jgi:NADP-dependent 3-hydroxy acid dehydrogenase YdfG
MTTLEGKVALVTGASRGTSADSTSSSRMRGVGAYGPFLDLAPDFLEEMIDINVKGSLYAVRAALPTAFRPMTESSWG